VTRARTIETVSGIERRLRAASVAAAALAVEAADQQLRNRQARAVDLQRFNTSASQNSFACAVAAARRRLLTLACIKLGARQQAADESARIACEAVVPWSQLRAGLERRRARQLSRFLA